MAMITRAKNLLMSVLPLTIIIGLLGAALFVKPAATGKSIDPPIFELRDRFFGISVPDESSIWIVGNNGKVLRSGDGGKSWERQQIPGKWHLQDMASWDRQRAVAVGNDGTVIVTRDGGKKWVSVPSPLSSVANKLLRVKIAPDGSVWAVGEMGAVLQSRDFGSTWTRKLQEDDIAWNDIFFADGQKGWAVGEFGRIIATRDGGQTWVKFQSPVKCSLMGIASSGKDLVAVGMEGVMLVSRDGGEKWEALPKITTKNLLDIAWDLNRWVAVGDRGAVVIGDPAAMSWKELALAEGDVSWHTKVVAKGETIYLAGSSTGVLSNGKWTQFGNISHPAKR